MSTANEDRNETLLLLSQVVVNQTVQYKLDKVADIYINGLGYFTVFRRFNSVYEYIIESVNGDSYLHKNSKIRNSLKSILCLSDKQIGQMYSMYAFSYKHNENIEVTTTELADLTWSQVTKKYGAICVNFGGILLDYQRTYDEVHQRMYPTGAYSIVKEEVVPKNEIVVEPWSVVIPKNETCHDWVCYCQMDQDDDNYDDQYEEEDDTYYTVLRSGKRIPKN